MSVNISFIVPAYNVQAFLDECLQSLLDSSISGDEIILVNDGSKDQTLSICNSWFTRHPNLIKLLNQENQGLSAARNNGFQNAVCPYVLFMDSDDVVLPESVAKSRVFLEELQPDILVMDFNWWKPEHKNAKQPSPPCAHEPKKLLTDPNKFCIETFNDSLFSACSRIFKRTLLKKLEPEIFPLGKSYEEIATVPRLTLRANSIFYLNETLFNYRIRAGSITQSKTIRHCLDLSVALRDALMELDEAKASKDLKMAANVASSKLLLTAIRDCGLVKNKPDRIYQSLIVNGLSVLTLSLPDLIKYLKQSHQKLENKTATHLFFIQYAPGIFILTRKIVYVIKRRRMTKKQRIAD